MYINKINITNFKKIEHIELNFNKGFNLIIGDNSSGKTSVLEAISVALGGFWLELIVSQQYILTEMKFAV